MFDEFLNFLTVSEAVCKEYEQLKHQYDTETSAMHKAMQQASQVNARFSHYSILHEILQFNDTLKLLPVVQTESRIEKKIADHNSEVATIESGGFAGS